MMEGLNQLGQEEYIWAMRTSAYRESETDIRKEGRSHPSLHRELKKTKSTTETTIGDRQTKVMASLVPDEVIYNVNDYNHREYDACFLFGDVSGFTELCEKYTKTGVSGPSRMTQVLNKYLGSMVQEVMAHNGDVLKFSGDAFLAIFKVTETESMRDVVHEALDCALVIQKNYGSYLTDVGVVIRVKLAISSGLVTFALIGNETTSHYVVVGKPIWDVKAAESISSAGDIIVAPAAWKYVNLNEYIAEDMQDRVHVRIVGVGPNWRSTLKNVRQQRQEDEVEEIISHEDDSSSDSDVLSELTQEGTDEYSLRPAVNTAVRLRIKESLRRFIILPVMKSIDMDEPFEYLTEMRQAVIVFINVVSHKLQTKETVILADQTYKIVCSVVDKLNGCVNKVSLFDKDLMFVVIFGLRGLKHELECQVALRCARQCYEAIHKLPGVLSTSIGVTTGKTYCGVFGHTLRREYTVISLIVNKAARLMVAYKNKVTCDRETFLHSKLEAKHFILQEQKALKGISHPGPVYEFREIEKDPDEAYKINACPLLGRERYIKLYKQLLEQNLTTSEINEQQCKMLLITGDARQGTTRLLDELVYLTPQEIPVNKVILTEKNQNIPYRTLKTIFSLPLVIDKNTTTEEKKRKILNRLEKLKVPELICVLNNVFDVDFKISSLYTSLNENEKKVALKKIMKHLCYSCFTTLWVIAIDDFEFMDADTWDVFDCFFDTKTVFVVGTMSREKLGRDVVSQKVVDDPRVKTVHLGPIERWYLGALACQILDVYAISPELENAIQTRSNGNPGWIESFLITLIQDHGLYILKATLRDINDLGLVCPPLYMMARLTKEQTRKWQTIMEERRASLDSITADEDNWKRYIDSCRNSYLNVTIREEMEAISKGDKVPICVISPTFNVADEEMELSMDAMILKTFDSLNFFEQLLVKCSAILGNQFLTSMLLYVMSATDKRKAALAVKKLFEIGVLTCAKGDFLETGFFKDKLMNPNDETGLKCRCRGLKIDVTCVDLPQYASCGYLQFRSSLFREITYNLLTDNQKKEFHGRAIRYLERETRKCGACGGGFFVKILGYKYDKEFKKAREKSNKAISGISAWEEGSRRTSYFSSSITSGSISGRSRKSKFDEKSLMSLPSQIFGETAKSSKNYDSVFGFAIIRKLKNSYSLTRTFSNENFTDCCCNLILSTTYAQLIKHCKGAGDLSKVIDSMLEYAQVCIQLSNLPLAISTLEESLEVLREKAKERTDNMWKVSLIRAKIYNLLGYSRLELGHLDEALVNLHLSLNEYGIKFPTGFNKHIKIYAHNVRQLFGLYIFPRSLTKRLDHWEIVYANNLSSCLSHLCTFYMIKNQWKDAEMAATWCLTKSLQSFSDFRVVCYACTNMIRVAQYFQKWSLCIALEIHALRLCHLKKTAIDAEDLKCVGKLYFEIFSSRVSYGHVEKAIHLGYIVLRMCASVNAVKTILPLLPVMIHCLMIGNHFANVYSVLQELSFFAAEVKDSSGRIWYHAICAAIQLETGYTVLPYQACERFHQLEGETWVTIRDPDARRRFFTLMWLWCLRNEKWEAASIWCLKTTDFKLISEHDTMANKITTMYLLEGLLLFLVNKMDKRNIKGILRTQNEIETLFKKAEKAVKTVKTLLPRLYHLKAYYHFIQKFDSKVIDLLNKATNYANKYGNTLELGYIEHSTKAWSRELKPIEVDAWKDHIEVDNLLDFQEIDILGDKVNYFTLPTPTYV